MDARARSAAVQGELLTDRLRFLAAAAVLVPLGLASKRSASAWLADELSGALYVVFWIFAALALRPRWPRARVAAGVLIATIALEFAQLWHPPWLERIRATFLGHALLGSLFVWEDIPYYALGALAGYVAARAIGGRAA